MEKNSISVMDPECGIAEFPHSLNYASQTDKLRSTVLF